MKAPTADSPAFTRFANMPEELGAHVKWELANSDFLGLDNPIVLNWSENQTRRTILVIEYEADDATARAMR